MVTHKMIENANKLTYLVKAYPEKNIGEIIGLFRLSPIDVNCAIWAAIELGFLQNVEPGKEHFTIATMPPTWDFGDEERELEDSLTYAFEKINAEEKDMEENYLSNWTTGYAPQDVLVATKRLLEDNVLHEYELEDGESAYIFYTLKKNEGKNWGAKQFKVNPLTGEPNEEAAEAEKSEKSEKK